MEIKFPRTAICGISCRLCPAYLELGGAHCAGCKGAYPGDHTCAVLVCAMETRKTEFCWECAHMSGCDTLANGRICDTVAAEQDNTGNILWIRQNGIDAFERCQEAKEKLLREMLHDYDEGQSVNSYCVAAARLDIEELQAVLTQAWIGCQGSNVAARSELLHSLVNRLNRPRICSVGSKT